MAMRSIRQLRTRTVPLRPEGGPPDSTDLLDDPLGIGVQTRAREADMNAALSGEPGALASMMMPLSWKGFFQTLKEKNARIGGIEGLPNVGPPSTAGDELAGVAASMSDQPGSMQALALATRQRKAKEAAQAKVAADAVQASAPKPPPASSAPPRPGTAPQPLDPTLAQTRYRTGMMVPGSLAALRRTLYETGD